MNLLSRAKIWCPLSVLERVRIIEGFFFLKKIYESFAGTLETVRNREVSVQRGWTVLVAQGRMCVHENYAPSVRKCTHGYLGNLEAYSRPRAPLENFCKLGPWKCLFWLSRIFSK